jgi:hypothetical protein
VVGERSVSVGTPMALEREHLLPLAKDGFDLAAVRFPLVNTSGCIKVLTNSYSVLLAARTEVEATIHAYDSPKCSRWIASVSNWRRKRHCTGREDRRGRRSPSNIRSSRPANRQNTGTGGQIRLSKRAK